MLPGSICELDLGGERRHVEPACPGRVSGGRASGRGDSTTTGSRGCTPPGTRPAAHDPTAAYLLNYDGGPDHGPPARAAASLGLSRAGRATRAVLRGEVAFGLERAAVEVVGGAAEDDVELQSLRAAALVASDLDVARHASLASQLGHRRSLPCSGRRC
jgi:hypothetical protein